MTFPLIECGPRGEHSTLGKSLVGGEHLTGGVGYGDLELIMANTSPSAFLQFYIEEAIKLQSSFAMNSGKIGFMCLESDYSAKSFYTKDQRGRESTHNPIVDKVFLFGDVQEPRGQRKTVSFRLVKERGQLDAPSQFHYDITSQTFIDKGETK